MDIVRWRRSGRPPPRAGVLGVLMLLGLVVGLAAPSVAAARPLTERVSVRSDGAQAIPGVFTLTSWPAISADGRFVAFASEAPNLVPGDANGDADVFVRDRATGMTERVSVSSAGVEADAGGLQPAISADGRFVAFASDASNLARGAEAGGVFVRDRQSRTTELVSVSSAGAPAATGADWPAISGDGRFVAFESSAPDLVVGDTNGHEDVFVHDRRTGTTERVSIASDGAQANSHSYSLTSSPLAISGDGRFVVFESWATNLVPGDTNTVQDIFLRDRHAGTTLRVVKNAYGPRISADGRFIAFVSKTSNLVANDINGFRDVFVRDRQYGTTERVNVSSAGSQADGWWSDQPAISADGRFVAFMSVAGNLVADDTGWTDVFVRDRLRHTTERVSVTSTGGQANQYSWTPAISADGRAVAFTSEASNLVAGDTNGYVDVFVRDRGEGAGACSIEGTPDDDVLAGTAGDDVICGLGGDDRISGGGGHDVLDGGDGDDQLSGATGRDWLDGGPGGDHLTGGSGADTFNGGAGVDRASYFDRTGAVTVTIGGWQNDGAAGEYDDVRADVEQIAGGHGDDTLTGDDHDNRLRGNSGHDHITGGAGLDWLDGSDGGDTLDGRDSAADRLSCGAGLDSVLSDPLDWLSASCETL